MQTMNEKLVRDKIPEIMRTKGETPDVRTLSEEEYKTALDAKLREEVAEYLEANDLAELADILEVIRAIALARGMSLDQLEDIRERKFHERGGFADKISLSMEGIQ